MKYCAFIFLLFLVSCSDNSIVDYEAEQIAEVRGPQGPDAVCCGTSFSFSDALAVSGTHYLQLSTPFELPNVPGAKKYRYHVTFNDPCQGNSYRDMYICFPDIEECGATFDPPNPYYYQLQYIDNNGEVQSAPCLDETNCNQNCCGGSCITYAFYVEYSFDANAHCKSQNPSVWISCDQVGHFGGNMPLVPIGSDGCLSCF